MSELLSLVGRLVKADLHEVVYQTQRKQKDATADQVVAGLRELEDAGLVEVEIVVSLTPEGKKCL